MIDTQDDAMIEQMDRPDQKDCTEVPDYRLHVSSNKVTVLLDCPDPHTDTNNLIHRILTDFKFLEIPEYPDAEILASILEASCQPGEFLCNHAIMMGQNVQPSEDGRLDWARDFFAEGWTIDEESGVIDFWSKLETRSVEADELIVRLYHPVDGTPGLNVFGNEIPVSKPGKVKLRSGKNIHAVETEGFISYKAACPGRVRYTDGTVSVDDVYVIKGDVNLETGNIVHTGAVMIQGDVGVGASIEAQGDIMVKGMLEPCNIKGGANLTVAGGIVGEEGYRIELAGDLIARYISEANIVSEGNIIVGNEIAHSDIRCLGKVDVPKGRIAGGTTLAKKGIQVGEAGASGSSDTKLIAGVDFTLREKINWHEEKILKLEESQEKIQQAVKLGLRKRDLTDKELQTLNGLKQKVAQIGQILADEHQAIQKLKIETSREDVEEIIILKELWSGTIIQLGGAKTVVRRSVLKPRIALKRKGDVKIMPLGEGNMPRD